MNQIPPLARLAIFDSGILPSSMQENLKRITTLKPSGCGPVLKFDRHPVRLWIKKHCPFSHIAPSLLALHQQFRPLWHSDHIFNRSLFTRAGQLRNFIFGLQRKPINRLRIKISSKPNRGISRYPSLSGKNFLDATLRRTKRNR